jgi:catechol 2,3-dioxygenase-like lactoylglutathione lyase family enzyme
MKNHPIGVMEHVGVVMEDLAAARVLFHEKLALPIADYPDSEDGPAFAVKVGKTVIRVASTQSVDARMGRLGVNHVAFKVSSLGQAQETLKEAGAKIQAEQATGSGMRSAIWSDPATTIGIPLQFLDKGAALEFKEPSKQPFIERVDHLGIAAESGDRARKLYVDGLGWTLESTQTDSEFLVPIEVTSNDKYGATSHSHQPIAKVGSGLIALFVTVGDFDLEIMQPIGAAKISTPLGTIPGSVGQDQGAIAQALQKRGEGLLHICFKVPDIDAAIKRVTAEGIAMIDPVSRPGSRSGRIAFMDRRSTERVLLHFIQRTPIE